MPAPPSLLVPKLADVQRTGSPAWVRSAGARPPACRAFLLRDGLSAGPAAAGPTPQANYTANSTVAILWVLPPKFQLQPERAYPPITVKQGALAGRTHCIIRSPHQY